MTELKNDRYLRALLRQPVDVTPVWTTLHWLDMRKSDPDLLPLW